MSHGFTPGKRPTSRTLLLAVCVACAWLAFLLSLAVTTANPIVLNREQIARADFVVTATVSESPVSLAGVEKEWKSGKTWRAGSIAGLEQCQLEPGVKYVIPISEAAHEVYQVTPVRNVEPPGWVYPVTESALEQLRQILSEVATRTTSASLP